MSSAQGLHTKSFSSMTLYTLTGDMYASTAGLDRKVCVRFCQHDAGAREACTTIEITIEKAMLVLVVCSLDL